MMLNLNSGFSGLGAWAWEATVADKWAGIWSTAYANFYERSQYGNIPMPTPPPVPPAPQTEAELVAWTPDAVEAVYGPVWEQWAKSQSAAVATAEQSGEYTPGGAFLGTYTAWESAVTGLKTTLGSNWYLWVGGAAMLGVLLLSHRGRY